MTVTPQPRIATGKGGWSFVLNFTDAASNPVDVSGYTPYAEFYQGNIGRTTPLTVQTTRAAAGQVVAVVPVDVVLSTLIPFANAALVGTPNPAQPYPFRVHAYLVDSLGSQFGDQIVAVQPIDPRIADPSTIPAAQPTSTAIGPAGAAGSPGNPGPPGPAGGIAPKFANAAQAIKLEQVVRSVTGGIAPASSTDATQAGTVVGIAVADAAQGTTASYRDGDVMTDAAWDWVPGLIFFDNNGLLTQTPPAAGFLQSVARVVTPISIAVALSTPRIID